MPKRALELEIRKGRAHADVIEVVADPDDVGRLQDSLTGWLEDHGWKRETWGRFEMLVRAQGTYRILKKVRAPRGRP